MTTKELLRMRLQVHHLAAGRVATPADVVRSMGAVQAQDYLGSLWAVGQRVESATEQTVEDAIARRAIVRSWPMRGTLHFVLPEDLRWMLSLLAPRVIHKMASIYRTAGVTNRDFVKGREVVEKNLRGGKMLERNEIYELFKQAGIDPSNTRGLHIIGHLAMEQVICFGPRRGKQPTFVLLDEWLPAYPALSEDESFARLATTYFNGHGPASIHDLAWWAGITITESTRALSMIEKNLEKVVVDGVNMWMAPGLSAGPAGKTQVRLLPAFDEFLVSYHDRSAAEAAAISRIRDVNNIFASTVIVNGHIAGVWKRDITGNNVKMTTKKFESFSDAVESGVRREMRRYAAFINKKWIEKD